MSQVSASRLQEVIETVEALPFDDQALLIELVRHRLVQDRRAEIVADVSAARADYQSGQVRRGSVADLMKEVAE